MYSPTWGDEVGVAVGGPGGGGYRLKNLIVVLLAIVNPRLC